MASLVAVLWLLQAGPIADIDSAVRGGIRDGAFPGAVVVVGTRERTLLAKGYGHFTWSAASAVPNPDSTLFDLASLTKVVATTPAIMLLVDAGRIDLDRPVQEYLPEFDGEGKPQVTVRHLLEHRSGLRAFLPLNKLTATASEARDTVLAEPLRWRPGERTVYSDLNAMLLGWIVERVTGVPLDEWVGSHLYERIGMDQTRFRPPRSDRSRIAPVGRWRGHVIAGEVHDQNAVRLGGVSGHAGLYTTGRDLARYAQLLLRGGRAPDSTAVFEPRTVRVFTWRGAGNRALGWEVRDTMSTDNSGALMSKAAFGHGGYTGTSIWIDPAKNLFVIVLTNRVYAPRTGRSITRLKRVRGATADAAISLKDEMCSPSSPPARGLSC